eukprot:1106244-Prymnesium_polylepis.2
MTAPTLLSRHYMALMCARGKGAIMFVASIFGFLPAPYMAVYGATKAYIKMLGEALMSEMKPVPGIDVSILSPGLTDTPMGQPFLATNPGFPVDSPEHTAMVGLRALGGKHVVPLLGNNIAAFMMSKVLPDRFVRWNQRSMMSKLLKLKTNNPWKKTNKKLDGRGQHPRRWAIAGGVSTRGGGRWSWRHDAGGRSLCLAVGRNVVRGMSASTAGEAMLPSFLHMPAPAAGSEVWDPWAVMVIITTGGRLKHYARNMASFPGRPAQGVSEARAAVRRARLSGDGLTPRLQAR